MSGKNSKIERSSNNKESNKKCLISKRKLTEYLQLVKTFKLHYLKIGEVEIQTTPQTYQEVIKSELENRQPKTEKQRLDALDKQLFPDDVFDNNI